MHSFTPDVTKICGFDWLTSWDGRFKPRGWWNISLRKQQQPFFCKKPSKFSCPESVYLSIEPPCWRQRLRMFDRLSPDHVLPAKKHVHRVQMTTNKKPILITAKQDLIQNHQHYSCAICWAIRLWGLVGTPLVYRDWCSLWHSAYCRALTNWRFAVLLKLWRAFCNTFELH